MKHRGQAEVSTRIREDGSDLIHEFTERRLLNHAAERYVFVEILCRASEKQNNRVKINVEYLAQRAGATSGQVCSSLSKLLENGTLLVHEQMRSDPSVSDRTQDDNPPARTEPEGSRSDLALTDGTDERDEPDETDERDDVNSAPENATVLVEALKPFDLESKLQLTFDQRKVSTETQKAFLDAYPDPKWVAQQVFKALAWEVTNPHKKKKNFPRFLGNWLSRGWDEHTSKLPSNPPRGGRGFQRPAGAHERGDDLGAIIEQVKTEAFTETESLGGMNAAVG